MPLRQVTLLDQLPYRQRQLEEPNEVCNRRSVLSDRLGDLGMLHPELLSERLVALRFLERVQLLTLKIFHQREHEERLITRVSNQNGDVRPIEA